ncbi:uncharacterized protein YfaS (alpha-2-macroglobulin family) [Actinokineospora baliensis]|uniref:carboxypeptidase regulatory-like domain-containing protein n=1 Tax=Actinokineospora baliensis TaxID=547056 RepID=UPI001957A61D|nr:carboxypeptidase regulatory-like domain-containing protein [Actinokineospora baliensis]MBM7771273.1 uncharacterized protein YfaS (alpha-2-macroglobulin family) [Actinokineospora baliensis]
MRRILPRRAASRLGAIVAAVAVGGVLAAPATAQDLVGAAPARPDISLAVSFDKTEYAPADVIAVTVRVTNNSDAYANVTLTAPVATAATGKFGGAAFTDLNLNNKPDPGEPAPGVRVVVKAADWSTSDRTTDVNGRFDFDDLPAGPYTVTYTPGDLKYDVGGVQPDRLYISGDAYADVVVPAWYYESAAVYPQLTLDKPNYRPGDPVRATLILTNR